VPEYIKEKWDSFEKATLSHQNIGDRQRHDMKMTFYAGCVAIHEVLVGQVSDCETQEESVKVLEDVQAEIEEFYKEVQIKCIAAKIGRALAKRKARADAAKAAKDN